MKKWGLMAAESDPKGHYYGETTHHTHKRKHSRFTKIGSSQADADESALEFQDLVRETNYQAWSPTSPGQRNSGIKMKRPQDAILVENRIETSSDNGDYVKKPFKF